MSDPRKDSAATYDLAPHLPDDLSFYVDRLGSADATVLELGCGTGRVSIPLAAHCAHLVGIDQSERMLEVLRSKSPKAGLPPDRIRVEVGDITDFSLGTRFDLIIAPFRVLQNLETDAQLDGLWRCIREHLRPDGRCILTAFNPNLPPRRMRTEWVSDGEIFEWQVDTPEGTLRRFSRQAALQEEPLVLFPELIERLYSGDVLIHESVLRIAMRCYYPDELLQLLERNDFVVRATWGGYAGEEYGVGTELVVEFGMRRD